MAKGNIAIVTHKERGFNSSGGSQGIANGEGISKDRITSDPNTAIGNQKTIGKGRAARNRESRANREITGSPDIG
ncbi:MAG: hypothetical protein ACOX6N_04310, partial [Patescibacteria group bacterium]